MSLPQTWSVMGCINAVLTSSGLYLCSIFPAELAARICYKLPQVLQFQWLHSFQTRVVRELFITAESELGLLQV